MTETVKKHPMQPIVWVGDSIRFKENAIVAYLAQDRLNDIAAMPFSDEDRSQLAQLIGYSVSGFGGLDYADPDVVAQADDEAGVMVRALEGKK